MTDEATIRKDLDYYWKTFGDNIPGRKGSSPAMAQAIFCILNARFNNTDIAYSQFMDAHKPNEAPPFGVLAETAGGTNPYFSTGAGGFFYRRSSLVLVVWNFRMQVLFRNTNRSCRKVGSH